MLREPARAFVLKNGRTQHVIATRLEGAFDSASRRRGLLGRTVFEQGGAMIIAPCSSVHTFFMRMVIDVLFASREGRVVKTYPALPAWRIAFALRGFAAIELPPGTLTRSETKAGDQLLLAGE
jgi:uncharacterized membrane protein (UPF0127 family)